MYISKFQILNYKSFRDSDWLEFQPGINIIVGRNNSGKTALLESLALQFKDNPYRNIRMRDIPDLDSPDESTANITFRLKNTEISTFIDEKEIDFDDENTFTIYQEWLDKAKEIEVTVSNYNNEFGDEPSIVISDFPEDINLYQLANNSEPELSIAPPLKKPVFCLKKRGELSLKEQMIGTQYRKNNFPEIMFNEFKRKIYRFNAERFHIGNCPSGDNLILEPDASNLAEVISQIQLLGKTKIYEEFNKYVNMMFTEIKKVSARFQKKDSGTYQDSLEVLVWSPEALEEDEEDLALKLADCGTGVSQILAILYVVVTASEPKTIIIDEPQSFLHPNLIRQLIKIFKEFPQHQYFIATHSPIVISEANPATILQLSYSNGETKTKIINSKETTELRYLLKDLGVSLSDVFGADAILWVEAPTEELCFPRILEQFGYLSMKGIQIMAVKNTGDLEGKRARIIFDIYDKLSGGNSLFPPAIAFILDDENRSEDEKKNIRIGIYGQEKLYFIPRCTYENYLLHPQAIFEVLKQENPSLEIAVADIKNYIDEAEDKKWFLPKNCELKNLKSQVNGAKLISEIFSKFSNNSVEYRKTKHSLEITNWLLEHEQNYLQELAEFLKGIIKA
ncbi:ATP-dependent nuclease [Dapis sp. BLCC M229]|uniref:ATP-dependent nuclease n=1 Tax=Dapis sp. BLCC M229 TaxID=3400188 RepID=UPI003CE6883B